MDSTVDDARKRINTIFQRIREKTDAPKEVLDEAAEEFSTLIEELNIALEELQVNNETLVAMQQALEKEQQRFQELFDQAPDAYIVTDINGKIMQANDAASELFNLSITYLTSKPLSVFVVHDDQEKYYELFRPPRRITGMELKILPRGRPSIHASISLVPVKDSENHSVAIRWLIRDITSQKLEHGALIASEERFHTIFTHSHVGMLLTDLEGRIVETNLAFEGTIGYLYDELKGLLMDGLIHPKDREDTLQMREEIMMGVSSSKVQELRYLNKQEQEIWARQTVSSLPNIDGEAVYFIYLIENITEQRLSRIELSEMKRRMIESIESERLHLAQELHDGPIQDLYGAVFKLNETPVNDGPDHNNIKETQDLIKQVAGTLRGICGDLRPPTLSNFGLDRALQTHIEQIQDKNKGIDITLDADRDDHVLTQEVRLALFRIYQQSMANVLRHANANKVVVRLEIGEEEVTLQVEDNGVGFDPPVRMVELLRNGHYGLAGIAERVETLQGSLMIDSSLGSGTRVAVEIPREGFKPEQG